MIEKYKILIGKILASDTDTDFIVKSSTKQSTIFHDELLAERINEIFVVSHIESPKTITYFLNLLI